MYARILLKAQYLMMFGAQGYLNQVIQVTGVDAKGRLSMEVDVNDQYIEAVKQYSSSFTELVRVGQKSGDDDCKLIGEKELRGAIRRLDNAESSAQQAIASCADARAHIQKMVGGTL